MRKTKRTGARILGAGLAISLLFSQTAYADIIITPLDTQETAAEKQSAQESQTAQTETTAADTSAQTAATGQTDTGTSGQAETAAQTSTAAQTQISLEGPGAVTETAAQDDSASQKETAGQTETSAQTEAAQSGTTAQTSQLPEVPEISAEAGLLYDATHDQVLFEKNADEKLYPASITKLMTALLVLEKTSLDDTVTFSKTATTDLESGAVTLSLTEGDQVSVKDCLYGLLLKSANEVANGLAEHVGGSISGFADMMNARAQELGCTNTHFVNPNGLNSTEHYTTARDMAKIANAAFENQTLVEIASTLSYTFPATKNAEARTIKPGHKMLYESDSRYYPGIIAGKTGYTSLAGNTLVTCVEKNGTRLIAVVLKAKSTHYTDTKAMLDYGYELLAAQGIDGTSSQSASGTAAGSQGTTTADTSSSSASQGSSLTAGNQAGPGVETTAQETQETVKNGWEKIDGEWYYYVDGVAAVSRWVEDNGKWFYLGTDGKIVRSAWIDNQYYVGEDGIWLPDAVKS